VKALIIDPEKDGKISIFFDEPMCVSMQSNFISSYEMILTVYGIMFDADKDSLEDLSKDITALLQEAYSKGFLFKGELYGFMKNRQDMLILDSSNYENALTYVEDDFNL
jgi:hypothetical protein